jgi:hypothetical protein
MCGNRAHVRGVAVFPEVNALPRAQSQVAMFQGQRQIYGGESSPDMSRHIVVAFSRVNEQRVTIAYQTSEERFKVPANIRVGVFLDEQGR